MKYTREELQKGVTVLDKSEKDCIYLVPTPEKKKQPEKKTGRPERT